MTPREELLKIVRAKSDTPTICSICDSLPKTHVRCHCGDIADAILAAGYRKVEAGRDARETAQTLVSEVLKEHRHDDPRELILHAEAVRTRSPPPSPPPSRRRGRGMRGLSPPLSRWPKRASAPFRQSPPPMRR